MLFAGNFATFGHRGSRFGGTLGLGAFSPKKMRSSEGPMLRPSTDNGANPANVEAPESLEQLYTIRGVGGQCSLGNVCHPRHLVGLERGVLVVDWG